MKGLHAAAAARQIGAEIGVARDAQCQEASVAIERQFRLGAVAAALVIGEKDLAAAGDPFDRAADPLRRPRDQHVLGIDEILRAEPAADIGRDEAHPSPARRRARAPPRRASRAGSGPRHARCSGRYPGRTAPTMPRGSIGLVTIRWLSSARVTTCAAVANAASTASASPVRHSKHRLPGASSAISGASGGAGRHRIGDGRQRRVVDDNRLGGIERGLARLGDDQRDRLAGVAHLFPGEQRLRRKGEILAGHGIGRRPRARAATARLRAPRRRSAPRARREAPAPRPYRSARSAHGRAASAARPHAPRSRTRGRRDSGLGRSGT